MESLLDAACERMIEQEERLEEKDAQIACDAAKDTVIAEQAAEIARLNEARRDDAEGHAQETAELEVGCVAPCPGL